MTTMPTRPPDADLQLQLISDIGPELVQRWAEDPTMCQRDAAPVIPAMFRAFISAILRAPSVVDAEDFFASHHSLSVSRTPYDTTGAVLGFSSDSSSQLRSSVFYDLLHSTTPDSPLLPAGPALSFYCTAGAGAGDSGEYSEATVDHRAKFCDHGDSLRDVRTYALARVLQMYATAIRQKLANGLIADTIQRYSTNTFLTPYVGKSSLIDNVDTFNPFITIAMHDLYDAYYAQCSAAEKRDFCNRIVSAVLRVALTRPANVLPFVQGILNVELRFSVCRICLVQRFGIRESRHLRENPDDEDKGQDTLLSLPLTANILLRRYLRISPEAGRPNEVFPGLLAALIIALELTSGGSAFIIPDDSIQHRLENLREARGSDWSSFGAPKSDVDALRLALLRMGQNIISCSNIPESETLERTGGTDESQCVSSENREKQRPQKVRRNQGKRRKGQK